MVENQDWGSRVKPNKRAGLFKPFVDATEAG